MHGVDLILTLAGGFTAALVLGYVTHRLGLSPIVGYLIAGLLVGPHTPGFVANREMAEQLAEVGVILLMFGVGLHFHVRDLVAVRKVAILGAIVQSAIATGTGALAGHAFGWSWPAGIVFGLALSVASTVVLIRVLSDHGDLQSGAGRIAIGWLVVEDIFTVFVLVVLPAIFGGQDEYAIGSDSRLDGAPPASFYRVYLAGWRKGHSMAPGQGVQYALPRTVHAGRAGRGAGNRRRIGAFSGSLHGPGRVPRRDGCRPVGVQRASQLGSHAHARRVRRDVLSFRSACS